MEVLCRKWTKEMEEVFARTQGGWILCGRPCFQLIVLFILGAWTGGAVAPSPNKIIWGVTSTSKSKQPVHPAPPILFCNLQLLTVRLLLTHKFSKIPQLLERWPRPHHTVRISFFENYIMYKVILWIWLSWFFHQFLLPQPKRRRLIFALPTKKSFPHLWFCCKRCRFTILEVHRYTVSLSCALPSVVLC